MRIGPYEVLGEIGRGGCGVVYEARSPAGERLALKVLLRGGADRIARFERERRALGAFTAREGFVPLLDAGVDGDRPYLVMPFLAGGTLRDRLEKGRLGAPATLALARRLARTLGTAHARGIVHRDLKPENVLYDGDEPLVGDLGLAKHWDARAAGASQSVVLSATGAIRGTAGYMAPEQLVDASSVGPQADVFALGAILHECLSGRPAFEAGSILELYACLTSGRREDLGAARREAPAWFVAALERCLAPDPAARFADGTALLRALEAGARRRSRSWTLVAALAAIAVTATAGALAWRGRERSKPPAPAVITPPAPSFAELMASGERKREADDLDGALADFTRAVARDPSSNVALAKRAFVRSLKGDLDGAIADHSRVLERDARNARSLAARAGLRVKRGDLDGALVDYDRAVDLEPDQTLDWLERARVKQTRGDARGALADVTRAVELDGELVVALKMRQNLLAAAGEMRAAEQVATRVLELAPRDAHAYAMRAALRQALGEFDAAIVDATLALALDPTETLAWNGRAMSRATRKDRDGAIADLEVYLSLEVEGPRAANARLALEDLRAQVGGR